jgi:tRNA(fMet)-specific endonuclease VapC
VSIWLIDTDILVEYLRERIGEPTKRRIAESVFTGEATTSIVNVAELRHGAAQSVGTQHAFQIGTLDELLASMNPLPLDDEATREYAAIRMQLQRTGTPIGPMDALIAAVALANDATLVTNNVREFSRVPGLRVENWLQAT